MHRLTRERHGTDTTAVPSRSLCSSCVWSASATTSGIQLSATLADNSDLTSRAVSTPCCSCTCRSRSITYSRCVLAGNCATISSTLTTAEGDGDRGGGGGSSTHAVPWSVIAIVVTASRSSVDTPVGEESCLTSSSPRCGCCWCGGEASQEGSREPLSSLLSSIGVGAPYVVGVVVSGVDAYAVGDVMASAADSAPSLWLCGSASLGAAVVTLVSSLSCGVVATTTRDPLSPTRTCRVTVLLLTTVTVLRLAPRGLSRGVTPALEGDRGSAAQHTPSPREDATRMSFSLWSATLCGGRRAPTRSCRSHTHISLATGPSPRTTTAYSTPSQVTMSLNLHGDKNVSTHVAVAVSALTTTRCDATVPVVHSQPSDAAQSTTPMRPPNATSSKSSS
eukprot:PhM_4_TR15910/c0_g1_i2/m.21291